MRPFLFCSCLLAAAISSHPSAALAAGDGGPLRVATFRADLTPPLGTPTYPSGKPLETVETPLWAKGVVLDDGRQRVVLCAIDWCGLCGPVHRLFRDKLAEGAATEASHVTVHTVHQHTAPYLPIGTLERQVTTGGPSETLDPSVIRQLAQRLGDAVKASLEQFRQFDSIGAGQAPVERVAAARRILTDGGKILTRWSACKDPDLRAKPEGRIDPMLKTITLAHGDKPLVRIHYYATHPQSFYGDARVCYDVPGFARERLEEKEQVFQIYFTGCAGDVTMGKYNDGTPQARTELADRLYAAMEASVAATRIEPAGRLVWRTLPLVLQLKDEADRDLAKNRALRDDPTQPAKARQQASRRLALAEWLSQPLQLNLLRLGPVQVVHLPGESMIEFQLFTQQQRPDRFLAVAAYGDLATGYICTEEAFSQGGYEPSASRVAPNSEAALKQAIRNLLEAE
ncbi:MAG: hypothetical protein GX575_28010 [Candidatus Anammoximicrobium sp.]|nr:hypothetical protein [Candidatus Anammoximicrobium sp.]